MTPRSLVYDPSYILTRLLPLIHLFMTLRALVYDPLLTGL